MPSIYDLKPRFQQLLRPAVGALARAGVTANQVTVAALILSALWGALLCSQAGELAPARWALLGVSLILFARMALNAIDGMLAREHNMMTPLGRYLNELGDVLADAALYLPFGAIAGLRWPLVAAVVVLGIVSELAGVLGETRAPGAAAGTGRRYDGPMGKSDRAFLFGALGLLLGLGIAPGGWIDGLMLLAIALEALTIVNRVRRGLEAQPR